MSIKQQAEAIVADTKLPENVRDFAMDVTDYVREIEDVAGRMGVDPNHWDMITRVGDLKREIDRQRRAIAQLKRGGSVLVPESGGGGWSV